MFFPTLPVFGYAVNVPIIQGLLIFALILVIIAAVLLLSAGVGPRQLIELLHPRQILKWPIIRDIVLIVRNNKMRWKQSRIGIKENDENNS